MDDKLNKFKVSLFLSFSFFLYCCETPSGHPGASSDIGESKKRHVFIKEYKVAKNPYMINDTLFFSVEKAWLEKKWTHLKKEEETLINQDSYQLCIICREEDKKGINNLDWTIGLTGDKYLRSSGKNSLIGDFERIPGDTIEYKVQMGDNLGDNSEKVIIGDFILIRKK